jgi:hypothetical protein
VAGDGVPQPEVAGGIAVGLGTGALGTQLVGDERPQVWKGKRDTSGIPVRKS